MDNRSVEERLLAFVIKEGDCWLFSGSKTNKGYGKFSFNGHQVLAHKASYHLFKGPIGESQVLHTCDTPACINPCHLFLGTQKQNIADCIKKKRGFIGELNPSAKLTNEQIKAIRLDSRIHREIASDYGVSRICIGRIKSGVNYASV